MKTMIGLNKLSTFKAKTRRCKHVLRSLAVMLTAGTVATACQDSAWDDHYGYQDGTVTQNLIEVLEQNPDYSSFMNVIRQQRLDTLLTADQTFTVWAPTNSAMEKYVSDGETAEHLIKNHICRFMYDVNDLTDTTYVRIKMLNGKFQDFQRTATGYSFANVKTSGKSFMASNGVIRSLEEIAPFYLNLYEYIKQPGNETDSLAKHLRSFDVYEFDQAASTVIGKNAVGQLVYDSVFNYSSKYMKRYGDIYREDSLYTMVLPTNTAWKEGYDAVKKHFRTFGTLLSSSVSAISVPTRTYDVSDNIADSLADAHTKEAMISDLVFRGKVSMTNPQGDSLTATSGNVFHHPADIVSGATEENVSNGIMWRTGKWNYKPQDTILKEIVVEAESTKNRTDAYANVYTRSAVSTNYVDSVSETKYIEVTATTTSARTQPTVQFTIPNTLSATYNVYCYFVPAEAYSEDVKADSTRVNFYLNYVDEDGTMKEKSVIASSQITNGTAMTQMYVTTVTLPYANYTDSPFKESEKQDNDCVRLRVQTNVAASETSKLARTMRIDKIVFEPVIPKP